MAGRLPNFLYIGSSKSGSTWIFDVLAWHPDVFLSPAKDIQFFDQQFHRGLSWYRQRFAGAGDQRIVGEISHDYMYSEGTAERIASTLGEQVRLLVCLREPASRAFSAYLHHLRDGLFTGSFEEAIEQLAPVFEFGMYARYLEPYFERFDRRQIRVKFFDDLRRDPAAFAQELFGDLGVAPHPVPQALLSRSLPASTSRSQLLARAAKEAATLMRRAGLVHAVGAIKSHPLVQRALYRDFRAGERPVADEAVMQLLRERYRPDVERLGELLGEDVSARWGHARSGRARGPR